MPLVECYVNGEKTTREGVLEQDMMFGSERHKSYAKYKPVVLEGERLLETVSGEFYIINYLQRRG